MKTNIPLGAYLVVASAMLATVTVDGNPVEAADQPKLFVWPWGSTHTLQVSKTIDVSPGVRDLFVGWNDNETNTSRTVLADRAREYVAEYTKQFELSIESRYGFPTGCGWYDQNSTAQVQVDSDFLLVFTFNGWSGGSHSTSQT